MLKINKKVCSKTLCEKDDHNSVKCEDIHETEKHFANSSTCLFCTRKLANKYSCRRHMVTCVTKAGSKQAEAGFPIIEAGFPIIEAGFPILTGPENVLQKPLSFKCESCYKTFTRKTNLNSHMLSCKRIQHPYECYKCHGVFSSDGNLSRHMKSCGSTSDVLSKLMIPNTNDRIINIHIGNVTNTNNTSHTNNNTLTNNINVNSFGNEDKSHIDQVFIDKCLRGMLGDGVPNMVKRLHLDPNAPENHNVQIYSTKHSLMKIKEDNEWNIKDRNDVLDKVIHNSLALLYNNFHNPDSHVKKEDQEQHFNMIATRMLEISNKLPRVHFPLRRKVFALVLNFCDQLTDITKDI